jgi:hypothetical protein
MANLPNDGREYFHWPITDAPTGAQFEAYIAGAWVPATSDGTTVTLLLEGPNAPDHNASATVLPASQNIRFRVANITPEVVVRGGGTINLT